MKKSVFIVASILVLVSVLCVNAEIIKKPTLWGFGMRLTGKTVTVLPTQPANQVTCTDSDRSSSYDMTIYGGAGLTLASRPDVFTPGNITFIPPGNVALVVKDECFNTDHLSEGYCQEDRYQGRQGITCPNGCENGACISSGGIGIIQNECSGLEMSWPGIARKKNYTYALDSCTRYRCLVGNQISPACQTQNQCANYCTGTCVNIPEAKQKCQAQVCTDTDNGINLSVKGYVKAGFGGGSDCCVDAKGQCAPEGSAVLELYCSPNSPNGFDSVKVPCENGCKDGACTQQVKVLGPPPIAPEFAVTETVTCLFAFPTKTPVCTSPKGSCTGVLDGSGSSTCTVQVTGAHGGTVTWTSDCGKNAKPAVTTINGQNENAGFVCTDINMPNLLPYRLPGGFI